MSDSYTDFSYVYDKLIDVDYKALCKRFFEICRNQWYFPRSRCKNDSEASFHAGSVPSYVWRILSSKSPEGTIGCFDQWTGCCFEAWLTLKKPLQIPQLLLNSGSSVLSGWSIYHSNGICKIHNRATRNRWIAESGKMCVKFLWRIRFYRCPE